MHQCDKAAELPSVDAARIAADIRSEVDAGRRRFSDFLILTRKKVNRIAPYAAALEALNIPAEVSGAGAFGESREVEALTKLVRALADPQDPVALVAVLRGPLFGIRTPSCSRSGSLAAGSASSSRVVFVSRRTVSAWRWTP